MIALLPARQGRTLACSALLMGLLAGCNGSVEPAPAGSAGSTASEAGAAAEPTVAGASGTDEGGNSNGPAGGAGGGLAGDGGGVASEGGESAGGAAPQLREDPAYASSVESFGDSVDKVILRRGEIH